MPHDCSTAQLVKIIPDRSRPCSRGIDRNQRITNKWFWPGGREHEPGRIRIPLNRDRKQGPTMQVNWGPGLHVAVGRRVNSSAYEQYIGRRSRLFVPAVLAAAGVAIGDRVLDVATGPGEAAAMALSLVGPSGLVVGADIAPAMLDTAKARFAGQ